MKRTTLFITSFVLIVGCSTSKKYSLSELQSLLEDRTQEQVKEIFGPPSNTSRDNYFYTVNGDRMNFPGVDVWEYYPRKKILWDGITEKYQTLEVFFVTRKVISVSSPNVQN